MPKTAQDFKKMIQQKQQEKVWAANGTEFPSAFKSLSTEREIHLYSTFSEKKLVRTISREETYAL